MPNTTEHETLYEDCLTRLRRESAEDGNTVYHLEVLSCDRPEQIAIKKTFATQSAALEALCLWVRQAEENWLKAELPKMLFHSDRPDGYLTNHPGA